MGGNAFKDTHNVVRLNKEQLEAVYDEFYLDWYEFFDEFMMIKSYHSKDSFGDLDIIVSYIDDITSERWNDFIDEIKNCGYDYKVNSNVISMIYNPLGYGDFQVDIIKVDMDNFESSLSYYAYNDAGNLRGRIAHKLGLKLGHDGLSYVHRDGDRVCFEICLSDSATEIDNFLGFPADKVHTFWKDGPNTLEDIFEYITSSKYFHPDIYLLQNRNYVSRTRDKKRKTYTEFLKWCESLPSPEYVPENKSEHVSKALEHFNCKDMFDAKMQQYKDSLIFKEKFNGSIVSEITGLEGKDLGMFMQHILVSMKDPMFMKYLTPETIKSIINDYYKVVHND